MTQKRIHLDPHQCVILLYNAGNDRNGNPRRTYVIRRVDLEYMPIVAMADDNYDGFDALRNALDYRRQGPWDERMHFDTRGTRCANDWDRRRDWERRVIQVRGTATEIKDMKRTLAAQQAEAEQ